MIIIERFCNDFARSKKILFEGDKKVATRNAYGEKLVELGEFTKHAYLAIERMNYIPRLRVGIEKGKAPTIRYLEDNSRCFTLFYSNS